VPRGIEVVLAPTAGPYPSFDGIRLVLLETPANPGLDVCNIAVLAGAAHKAGALVAVDNTTATPIGRPRWTTTRTWWWQAEPRR
jgi:cystathionine gamma-lyase